MFPRTERLSRPTFSAVLQRAQRRSSAHFTLLTSPEGEGYAVVVSKKVAKSSVDRHKLKRRVIGCLRGLTLPPVLVVYPRGGAATLSAAEMKHELAELLSKRRA